jgi:hypothetical protein
MSEIFIEKYSKALTESYLHFKYSHRTQKNTIKTSGTFYCSKGHSLKTHLVENKYYLHEITIQTRKQGETPDDDIFLE